MITMILYTAQSSIPASKTHYIISDLRDQKNISFVGGGDVDIKLKSKCYFFFQISGA